MVSSSPDLVAHRGYAYRYPENTMLAIQAAVELGARFIEFDVLMSSDQIPVLFHDRDLRRMCGHSGAIHEYTMAQLKELSVSEPGKFGDRFTNNRITTLAEVVAYLIKVPDVISFVELKRQGLDFHGTDLFLEEVLTCLEPIKEQAVIISYDIQALLVTQQNTDYTVAAVFDDWRDRDSAIIRQLQPEYMFTNIAKLPASGELSCPDCTLVVYECADPDQAIQLHHRGVDMIETFQIKEMQDALNRGVLAQ
ncbi:MAG: glycerophosphodiester phosphodiesterase family protein [Thioalkalispiraceae bacterium]|jgi:glycerophosphoryl diester phosphodiesterase